MLRGFSDNWKCRSQAACPRAVRRAVSGADAVLCALGVPAFSRSRVRSEGTATIVAAMRDEGVPRRQEAILRDSGLDWMAVRPPFLTDGPKTENYAVDFGHDTAGLSLDISRADVAHCMLRAVTQDAWIARAPGISSRRS